MPPRWTDRARSQLSLAQREEISLGLAGGQTFTAIAVGLKVSPSTVSREVDLNGGREVYRAWRADTGHEPRLVVESHASSRPISCWSTRSTRVWRSGGHRSRSLAGCSSDFPDDPEMRVSHETIYRVAVRPGHAACSKGADRASARLAHVRRSRHATAGPTRRGEMPDMVIDLRTAGRGRGPSGAWALGRRPAHRFRQQLTIVDVGRAASPATCMLVKIRAATRETVVEALIEQDPYSCPIELRRVADLGSRKETGTTTCGSRSRPTSPSTSAIRRAPGTTNETPAAAIRSASVRHVSRSRSMPKCGIGTRMPSTSPPWRSASRAEVERQLTAVDHVVRLRSTCRRRRPRRSP